MINENINTSIGAIITIDGPAASGKGTLARRVATALGYAYIDTGAIYRLVAKSCLDKDVNLNDENAVITVAKDMAPHISISDFDDPSIRAENVSNAASKLAALGELRTALLDIQREMAKTPPVLASGEAAKGSVLDGRDTGTIICPNATHKFFITADTPIRADRRYKELQSKGISCSYESVLQDMLQRDERDSGRKDAPMKPAEDAHIMDTSSFSSDQVFAKIMKLLEK